MKQQKDCSRTTKDIFSIEHMDDKISPEYFHLIRKVLQEKEPSAERPLKRKRRNGTTQKLDSASEAFVPSNDEIITVDDSPEHDTIDLNSEMSNVSDEERNSLTEETPSNSDYDSDEFEDVTEPGNEQSDVNGDLSITMEAFSGAQKKSKETKVRNICSNEERKFRKFLHMADLACLMTHGAVRNSWISNSKLLRRLNKLVPDKVFQLLHPEKDEELPLRSTRKLLDGLKLCMDLWQKHWRITQRYVGYECYMRQWDELADKSDMSIKLTEREFVRKVLRGQGNRDIANQGFVALLRSCNVNARLIMSCQPPDFTDMKNHSSLSNKKQPSESIFKYPIFWCEVWDKSSKKWITIDPINLKTIEQIRLNTKLEPRGVASCERNLMRYVIAYDRKDGCKDVTRRYCRWFNAKCRKRRITKEREGVIWYEKVLNTLHRRRRTKIDDYEDDYLAERDESEGMPDNIQDLKGHPKYILEKDLHANQIIKEGCKECGYLNVNHSKKILKVYEKSALVDLKTARQWYNEGRILKVGCKSLKTVLKRSARILSSSDETREERLYSIDDTELYVAPLASVPDGRITKNTFGNIEILKPTMIPMNCCLIESTVAIKAANFLQVEYARAVTGFKFEKGNTTKPVIGGIVVAQWFKEAVLAAIDGIEYFLEREEFEKQDLVSLNRWNVLLVKLRIKNNLNETYGKVRESASTNVSQRIIDRNLEQDKDIIEDDHIAVGGGFLPQPTDNAIIEPPTVRVSPLETLPVSVLQRKEQQDANEYDEFDEEEGVQHEEKLYDDDYDQFMKELDL